MIGLVDIGIVALTVAVILDRHRPRLPETPMSEPQLPTSSPSVNPLAKPFDFFGLSKLSPADFAHLAITKGMTFASVWIAARITKTGKVDADTAEVLGVCLVGYVAATVYGVWQRIAAKKQGAAAVAKTAVNIFRSAAAGDVTIAAAVGAVSHPIGDAIAAIEAVSKGAKANAPAAGSTALGGAAADQANAALEKMTRDAKSGAPTPTTLGRMGPIILLVLTLAVGGCANDTQRLAAAEVSVHAYNLTEAALIRGKVVTDRKTITVLKLAGDKANTLLDKAEEAHAIATTRPADDRLVAMFKFWLDRLEEELPGLERLTTAPPAETAK